ncbi:YbgC/FadM family acyl-CoA thioesterase [Paracoccaceae bacterium GXU_MW_L88]
MVHEYPVRIYYQDTDVGGVTYHGRYIDFMERARTEMLRDLGVWDKADQAPFAVRHMEMDYYLPAKLDDHLIVTSEVTKVGGASITFKQEVLKDGNLLFSCMLTLVHLNEEFRPVRVPDKLRTVLSSGLAAD